MASIPVVVRFVTHWLAVAVEAYTPPRDTNEGLGMLPTLPGGPE